MDGYFHQFTLLDLFIILFERFGWDVYGRIFVVVASETRESWVYVNLRHLLFRRLGDVFNSNHSWYSGVFDRWHFVDR